MTVKIESLIICDDVRKEITHKELFIGVYSGNIVVPSYPTMLRLSFWLELSADSKNVHHLALKIESPSGNAPIEIEFDMNVADEQESAGFSLGGLPIHVERDGELKFSLKQEDGEWALIKRKKVLRGTIPSA